MGSIVEASFTNTVLMVVCMIPAISQVCSLQSPLETELADYAAGHCQAVEIWLTKLETWLGDRPPTDFVELLKTHSLTAPVASYQGGILATQGEPRKEAWELLHRRLDLCNAIGTNVLVVACDVFAPLDQSDLARVQASLGQLAKAGEAANLKIALEFQSRSALGNNLQTAAALVAEVGSTNLGLCFDAFHFYTGSSKYFDLQLLTAENLFHVQVCDLADRPRELAVDSDRILPGDGDIPLQPIIDHLKSINYAGAVSLEVLNPNIWQIPSLQVGEIGMTSLRRLLGQASMD